MSHLEVVSGGDKKGKPVDLVVDDHGHALWIIMCYDTGTPFVGATFPRDQVTELRDALSKWLES